MMRDCNGLAGNDMAAVVVVDVAQEDKAAERPRLGWFNVGLRNTVDHLKPIFWRALVRSRSLTWTTPLSYIALLTPSSIQFAIQSAE